MFGIGMPEMILILAIALIVIGPKKLPDLAKSLGRAMNEFKKATREIKDSIDVDGDLKDVKQSFDDLNTDLRDSINPLKNDPVKPPTESPAPSSDEQPGSASKTSPESTGEGNAKDE
ncbi:MAG: twin-arginine translocase TatA/TatE family subunit [Desulfobacterales bacterium]|jgi:TatA/E family protein of Tat protein translocase